MNLELVYKELSNGSKTFKEIFEALQNKNAISIDDIGLLYSDMSLDPNLVQIDSKWDFKNKHKLEEFFVHLEEEEEETEEEGEEEQNEDELSDQIQSSDSDFELF